MSENVLITGGTGLIGTKLSFYLKENGYQVSCLSRSKTGIEKGINYYKWDLQQGYIDPQAVEQADYIVHLAGAGVVDKRWTSSYKEEIVKSRTFSTALLVKYLKKGNDHIKAVVSSSAIGIYGNTGEKLMEEDSKVNANDFLSEVCIAWENAVDKIAELGIRTIKIRIGIVMSEKSEALKKIKKTIYWGLGAPLGSGNQYISWIHINDLCAIFKKAIEDKSMSGIYNGVAPYPVTNKEMIKIIAQILHKPLILPSIPSFVVKSLLGEMSETILSGTKVSSKKIESTNFIFKFKKFEKAIKNLLE